jgi:hypothetical protein
VDELVVPAFSEEGKYLTFASLDGVRDHPYSMSFEVDKAVWRVGDVMTINSWAEDIIANIALPEWMRLDTE